MSHQPPHPNLEQLQHWLQAVIMHPGGVVEGAKDSEPSFSSPLEAIVPPTSKQTSAERLGVYAAAYYLRLVDCLREFFPCLRFAMGDEVFGDFALAYLQKHPSQSYTPHHLADQFANFLAETARSNRLQPVNQPAKAGYDERWEDFFVGLARLEHAIEIVFDADGPEEPSPPGEGQGEGFSSAPLSPQSTLSFVPGFQLLAFRYLVSSYYTAWKHDEEPPLPDPQAQFIALFRRDYIVRRHELTPLQHALLTALQAGESLEQSLAGIAPQALAAGETADCLAANVREWFESWTRAEFFLRA
ncbi:MAG: putative DNA-binding domain-containing protein [Pirellulaceae bacterium]|nr:putative DNA-binding domain-containing protein [Pirellulaceae bacterium]